MIALLLIIALFAPTVWAQEPIYRATGNHGETSYSDVPVAGAVEISVVVSAVSDSQAQLVRERHAGILAMAEDLASARRARDVERAERSVRASAGPAQPVDNEPRYYPVTVLYPYHPFYSWPHRPRQAVHRMPERRPFEPVFRPISPAFGQ